MLFELVCKGNWVFRLLVRRFPVSSGMKTIQVLALKGCISTDKVAILKWFLTVMFNLVFVGLDSIGINAFCKDIVYWRIIIPKTN